MTELEELRAFITSSAFENMEDSLKRNLLEKERSLMVTAIQQYCSSILNGCKQEVTIYVKHSLENGTHVRVRGSRDERSREEKNRDNNLPRNYGKKWTPEEEKYLITEYGEHKKSLADVTAKLERTEASVSGHLLHMGILRFEDNYSYKSLCTMITAMGEPYDSYKPHPNKLIMLLTILALVYNKTYKEPTINLDEYLKIMFSKCWEKNIPSNSNFTPDSVKAFNALSSEPFVKENTEGKFTFDRRYFMLMSQKSYYTALKELILDLISKCL